MSAVASLLFFKLVLLAGLALWTTMVVLNNTAAFHSGVAAVGGMMNMQLFDQPPAIKTPLLTRRIASVAWHRFVYLFVLIVEVCVAALLWYATFGFVDALLEPSAVGSAVMRANLALSAFIAMAFLMALGGAWFAYYIRQESMQTTHFLLIVVAIAGAIAVNMAA